LLRCRIWHDHENDEIGPHAKLLGIRNLIVEFYVNATKQQRLLYAQLTLALSVTMKHYNAIQKHWHENLEIRTRTPPRSNVMLSLEI